MVIQKALKYIERYRIQISLSLIVVLATILHWPSLNYYFFQDDWFVLNWVKFENLSTFLTPREGTIYYRPLSMPLLFWFLYNIFGLNPFYFHIFAFAVFFATIIAVYKLFSLLIQKTKISLIVALLYSTWHIHFMSLSWFSTTSYILMTLFQALSFIFFIKYVNSKKYQFWTLSFLFFILGVLSHEFTLVLPFIFLAWAFLINRTLHAKYILPYALVDILWIIYRFVFYPVTTDSNYQPHFNSLVVDNMIWYVLWAFNFPERFKEMVDQSRIIETLKQLADLNRIVIPALITVILIFSSLAKNFKNIANELVFGIFWFSIGLLPVITLVNHSYTIYLSFSGLGILYIFAILLCKLPKLFMYSLVLSWMISSFFVLSFTRETHWIANEQAMSKAYTKLLTEKYPRIDSFSIILFREANADFSKSHNFTLIEGQNMLKQSFFDQEAVQVIYSDQSIKTIFAESVKQISLPASLKVYELTPEVTK